MFSLGHSFNFNYFIQMFFSLPIVYIWFTWKKKVEKYVKFLKEK